MSLTDQERAIVKSITLWHKTGMPGGPSFRDVSRETGLGLGTVHRICRRLRDDNVLEFSDHIARSLRPKGRKSA